MAEERVKSSGASPAALPDSLRGGVTLEAIRPQHAFLERALSRDSDVVRWTYYPRDLTDEQALARIHWSQEQGRTGRGQRYVVSHLSGEWLGTAGITALDGPTPELFYALLPQARGRGVATEAVRLLTDWAHTHGHPQVYILTLEGNVASENVAMRASYERVGSEPGEHLGEPVRIVRWVHLDS